MNARERRHILPSSVKRARLLKLFENAGGPEGVERILRDFYHRMSADLLIGFFFAGRNPTAIALKQKEFLMRAAGLARSFRGKPPARAHVKLPPILRGHFDRRLELLRQTLRDHGLSARDVETWVGFEESFRRGIIRRI